MQADDDVSSLSFEFEVLWVYKMHFIEVHPNYSIYLKITFFNNHDDNKKRTDSHFYCLSKSQLSRPLYG